MPLTPQNPQQQIPQAPAQVQKPTTQTPPAQQQKPQTHSLPQVDNSLTHEEMRQKEQEVYGMTREEAAGLSDEEYSEIIGGLNWGF